jgi:hypothetical protein
MEQQEESLRDGWKGALILYIALFLLFCGGALCR